MYLFLYHQIPIDSPGCPTLFHDNNIFILWWLVVSLDTILLQNHVLAQASECGAVMSPRVVKQAEVTTAVPQHNPG